MISTAYFMMGGPAAGKSTYIREHLWAKPVIDPDAIKEGLPGYDVERPGELHAKAKLIANGKFHEALSGDDDFVLDGTGTNFGMLIEKIRAARMAGFRASLVYITCTLSESLRRNRERGRTVDEQVVRDKYEGIEVAFEVVSKEVDSVKVI